MLGTLKKFVPSSIRRYLREKRRWHWFRGQFPTWSEAMSSSRGYADHAVLDRVVEATRQVLAGQGSWERDGYIFLEKSLHLPLLAAFKTVSEHLGARFTVIDFGGGLGSTWRQHASQLNGLGLEQWCVVEQPQFVEAGREFQNNTLLFFENLAEAFAAMPHQVVMLSGVLPYLERPYDVLSEILESGAEFILLDRNPFTRDGQERLTVQHTPPFLGGGSYPCWLLSRERVNAVISENYELVMEWPGFDDLDPTAVQYYGMLYKRKHSLPTF